MSLRAQLTEPLRYPDVKSRSFMTRRAWWLVVLSFVFPGIAQLVAGKRALGRFGIISTLVMLVFGLINLFAFLFSRVEFLSFYTNSFVLLLVQASLVIYGIIWLVLGFDTLRLTKLVAVKPNRRLLVVMLSLLLTLAPCFGAFWTAGIVGSGRGAIDAIFANKAPSVLPVNGRYNILLLGTDAGSDREGMRPDSISLLSVDAETGQSVIIGLPRELQNMPFPDKSPMHKKFPNGFCTDGCNTTGYLNAVFAEAEYFNKDLYPNAKAPVTSPGLEAMKDAVTGATGLQVQFYVLINMDRFASLIDALGGIDINVKERIQLGGDANGNYVEGYIEPGTQRMNGYLALSYARMRYGSARGDYDRMERQRDLQAAILAQMTPATVLSKFKDIAKSGSQLAKTDIPESMLGRFVDLATKARKNPPVKVELTPPRIEVENPDYNEAHRLVDEGVRQASPAPKEEQGNH